jgi:transposase
MDKAAQMILRAVVDGETDSVRLVDVAAGRVRASRETLERALTGKATAHHRFLLAEHLTQIEHLDEAIGRISEEMARRLTSEPPTTPREEEHQPASPTGSEPGSLPSSAGSPSLLNWQQAVEIIDQITGISQRIAEGLLAEIGVNMEQFPSAKHLASWVGIVRCITRLNIPGAARKNSKGGSWVNGLPHIERWWGTGACH